MIAAATLVLDNEAVQALGSVAHRKHRRVVAFLDEVQRRRARGMQRATVVVPVAVRVEAGWDRGSRAAVHVNRLAAARDIPLDSRGADRAVQLRAATGVSVVDATIGQAAEAAPGPVAVLTSDVEDMTRLAGVLAAQVRVVRL